MRQLIYAMQFVGQAAPVTGSAGVMRAATTATSCTLTTTAGPAGVSGKLTDAPGETAQFESEVTITGETSFREAGSIRFGQGIHRLTFTTVGQGYLSDSPEAGLKHGTVTWRIDHGEGQFAGASGLITSNFTIDDKGKVVDNHFGVIFVK
jgi:hypothetical protein